MRNSAISLNPRGTSTYWLGVPKLSRFWMWDMHLVEVVDDDTNEQVHNQIRPDQHEQHEKPHSRDVRVPDRLHIFFRCVHGRVHNLCPRLSCRNFEEGQQSHRHVVKLLWDGILPIQPKAFAYLRRSMQGDGGRGVSGMAAW